MTRWQAALLIGGFAGCAGLPAAGAVDPVLAERFDCAACHVDRLYEFQAVGAVTLVDHERRPRLDSGRQDASSTPDMCLSCHDGFVKDSRSLWRDGELGHPVGMMPSGDVRLPVVDNVPVFPMNDEGRMYCGTCHSPHHHSSATEAPPPFMRVDLETGQMCVSCHREQRGVAYSVHVPEPARRYSVAADYTEEGACTGCHRAHEAKGPVMWAQKPGSGQSVADALCNTCHEGEVEYSAHPHVIEAWSAELRSGLVTDQGAEMPVFDPDGSRALSGVIGCSTCHDAHRERPAGPPDERPGLFLRRADVRGFLCADCHGPSSLRRYQYFHSTTSRGR